MKKILFILFIPSLIMCQDVDTLGCELSDGTFVESGWYGYDTGDNSCNVCGCENGTLVCTEFECDPPCELDVDEDGICDDIDECIGSWVEDITSGDCNQFTSDGSDVCNSYAGCEWQFSWGGWQDYDSECVGVFEIDNSYCDTITSDCISDIDEDGICEDDCGDEIPTIFTTCECDFDQNPNTYAIYETIVDEEVCEALEQCTCECVTGVYENGECVQEEEGCWEEGELYCIGCELFLDECTYVECLDDNQWSNWIEIDDCENGCPCINPDWIDPTVLCTTDYNPVIGCDSLEYPNSCIAEAAGITSYIDSLGNETILEWDCEENDCIDDPDGVLTQYGLSCPELVTFGCDVDLSSINDSVPFGISVYEICPESCNECGDDIEGCMDEEACNFMASATIDDESCVYEGDSECEDCGTGLDFNNYGDNESFTETYYAPPGLIITINFSGSTESCCDYVYVNDVQYNGVLDGVVIGDEVLEIEWTTDGSVNSNNGYGWSAELICEEPVEGCTQPYAENYNEDANTDDGSCILDCEYFLSYDSYIDDYLTSNYLCGDYVEQGTYTLEQAISYGYNCDCVIVGCMDETATNYNEDATIEVGCSCEYEESCTIISVTGGSFPTEVSWEIVDSNAVIVTSGGAPYCEDFCFDDGCYTINMMDSYGDGWNNTVLSIGEYNYTFTTGYSATGVWGYNSEGCIIEGCTNPAADNYNEEANYDNDSCEYSCEYLLSEESYIYFEYDYTISNYLCGDYVEQGTYTLEQAISYGYNCDCVIVG